MLRKILALLCMTMFCLTIASYGAGSFPRPIADVPILTPEGKTFQLSQYRGKVLVVLVILTTCEHCQHSAELLSAMQKEFSQDFQAVTVAVNPEAPQQAAGYRQAHRLTNQFGYIVDENNIMKLADFTRDFHPLSPMYIFVNKKGEVRLQYFGDNKIFFTKEDENVRSIVKGMLAQ